MVRPPRVRTKEAMDRFIDERSRLGKPPTRLAHSLFRVISGQLAVFRADLGGAVAEAHWGRSCPGPLDR